MKWSSCLASVILCIYVFLTLALLLSSPVEMIRCLWHSDIWGIAEIFFWTSSTSRKSWQRGRERDVEAYLGCRHFKYKGFKRQTRFQSLGVTTWKNMYHKVLVFQRITGIIWTRLLYISYIISIINIIIPILTDNGLSTRHISSHLTINSLNPPNHCIK